MPENMFHVDLRNVPWKGIASGVALAVTGFIAWDDLGDSVKANAQSLDATTEATANAMVGLWEEIEDLSESVDESEDGLILLQRQLIEMNGAQRTTVAEIKGDVKLILRLLEENSQ